jgi:prolyl-tRNA editing enzyme YbaK/EbsC (Cys-tRNA(Pro) deacylase)
VTDLPASTERVLAASERLGLEIHVAEFPEGTKTSADAAKAVGCPVSAIAKSMLFVVDDEPVVVLMSGDHRVDIAKLGETHGGAARRADLDEVRRHTGFVAGGTPPFGHPEPLTIYADTSLRRNERVWASGGTPTTVFEVALADLVRVTGARWVDVAG